MITASELERELQQLLGLVHRLSPPLNNRPGLFLEQKDELAGFVASLITKTGGTVPKSPRAFCTGQVDAGHAAVRHNGRSIPIVRR